jgi:hypothetical protein
MINHLYRPLLNEMLMDLLACWHRNVLFAEELYHLYVTEIVPYTCIENGQ